VYNNFAELELAVSENWSRRFVIGSGCSTGNHITRLLSSAGNTWLSIQRLVP